MTYDRRLLPIWAEDAVLGSLAGESPTMWTEEKVDTLFEWAWRAIVSKRMLDRARDGEVWIEDFRDGEPVFLEREPHPVGLRLVPKS